MFQLLKHMCNETTLTHMHAMYLNIVYEVYVSNRSIGRVLVSVTSVGLFSGMSFLVFGEPNGLRLRVMKKYISIKIVWLG